MNTILRLTVVVAMACLVFTGCGGPPTAEEAIAEANNSNIKRVANLYSMVQMRAGRQFAGPQDEEEFKKVLSETAPLILERMGVDPSSIDSVFVSERDGEPFTIRYGIVGSPYGCQEPAIFEKTAPKSTWPSPSSSTVTVSNCSSLCKNSAPGGGKMESKRKVPICMTKSGTSGLGSPSARLMIVLSYRPLST